MKAIRLFVVILTLSIVLGVVVFLGGLLRILKITNPVIFWIELVVFLIFAVLFIYYSIRIIPADPPHKGVLVFLGRRQNIVLFEGWCFLPFYPIVFDIIKVDVTKNNEDLPEQVVKTPDLADLGFQISLTWAAGSWTENKERQAELLIAFLNSGGKEGVKRIYEDVIRDRLRVWAFSTEEGPSNWQEATGAKDEAIAMLVKAILGDDIPPISSDIPTTVLLRYFSVPRKGPLEYQKEKWGEQTEEGNEWQGLEAELNKMTPEGLDNLKNAVKERQEIVAKIKRGNGNFVNTNLGITINRFTINNVVLKGRVAEAVESRVREKEEREAEKTEMSGVIARIQELNREGKVPKDLAAEMVQTERGKVVKSINETKFSFSPELIKLVKGIFESIFKNA
jgi:hypothetical protein